MRKSFQITTAYFIITFFIMLVYEIFIHPKLLPTNAINIGFSLIPFSILLGIILTQIPNIVNDRLKELNENYFSPLLKLFYGNYFYVYEEDAMKIYNDIIKYGKIGIFPLYPWGLMREIDSFLKKIKIYYKLNIELKKISKEKINKDNLQILKILLGLESGSLEGKSQSSVNQHKLVVDFIRNYKPDFLKQLQKSKEEMSTISKIIYDFQRFLKENSLIMPKEPYRMGVGIMV